MKTLIPHRFLSKDITQYRTSRDSGLSAVYYYDPAPLLHTDVQIGPLAMNGNRDRETNMGDLTADALYYHFGEGDHPADCAMINSGNVRRYFPADSDISIFDCVNVHPFYDSACLISASGQQILDALEWGARYIGTDTLFPGFLQVSGIKYTIDASISSTVQEKTAENKPDYHFWADRPTGPYRVTDVQILDRETGEYAPLALDRQYNLAGYDFIVTDYGDGFAMLEGCEVLSTSDIVDRQILANYLKTLPPDEATGVPTITAGGKYGSPNGEGRITILFPPTLLTIASATVANKTYDGNTDGKVTAVTFDGLPEGEALTPGQDYTAEAVFEDAEVGTGKAVTVTVTLLNENYTLEENTIQTTANIKKRSSSHSSGGGSGSGAETGGKPPAETPSAEAPPTKAPPEDPPSAEEPIPAPPFVDVAPDAWYYEPVAYVYHKGLMNGTKRELLFNPEAPTTRAMVITVLARYDGADTAGGDVWYRKALDWAMERGISSGAVPEKNISREQLVTMLWRYTGQPESQQTLDRFSDADTASRYAREALCWSVEKGILTGKKGDRLDPKGVATRAEVAAMLMRFCQTWEPSE